MLLIVFSGIALWQFKSGVIYLPFVLAAAVILCVILFFPKGLYPLFSLWKWVGKSLGKITQPILLAVVFFLIFTPIAFFRKVAGKKGLPDGNWLQTGETTDFSKPY
ncbi:MAG: hypothetical protein JNL57_12045 [Bacteroidetes bacterium]|nr:hypothetical protein [Bacteroidota bacterium]